MPRIRLELHTSMLRTIAATHPGSETTTWIRNRRHRKICSRNYVKHPPVGIYARIIVG